MQPMWSISLFLAGLYLHLYLHSYREPVAPKQRRVESFAASSEEALRDVALVPHATKPGRNLCMRNCKMQLSCGLMQKRAVFTNNLGVFPYLK